MANFLFSGRIMNKREEGFYYEKIAGVYLEEQGYQIIEYNFYCRQGEIDIIAMDGDTLVFVEVKLRKSADFAQAMEFVDRRKQDKIRITASMYLSQNPTALQPRFDVIEIYAPYGLETRMPEITRIENAF